ncbi:MAG: glucose-1-phosphate adenylyltransferase [Thermoguttaceae bacterium]|nr:glucose-1-phosphate adenylyltransferase [Thermoguttaceae bacterium]MBR5759610.1 glucose-1-phosphate adenylyltransferase [Thermoguttaceae bacterium]
MKKNVIALILGGGRGTRLYPLTKMRAKPAVPIAGKYRLIDIPMSNCINSDLNKIYVITQFNSDSLHRHLASYRFDAFGHGFVQMLAAQQTNDSESWYQGTADAVRQNFKYIQQRNIDYVLILSGDQLYRMDFQKMIETHEKNGADVTIASVPVTRDRATSLGVMRIDEEGKVLGFLEKPKTDEELEHVFTGENFIRDRGYDPQGREYLANMGVYLFNRSTLVEALEKTNYTDFGKEVFPAAIRTKKVCVHLFDGYWEDIGTIRSFYEANLALAKNPPIFDISTPDAPTYSRMRYLPASRFDDATVRQSFIADGCQIGEGAVIENSIVGIRSKIGKNCVIRNSIIMGQDFFTSPEEDAAEIAAGRPTVGIGDNAIIDSAIIDKNCQIGSNVVITNPTKVQNTPELDFGMIRDGVICVEKGAVISPFWSLADTLKEKRIEA